MRILMFGWEFPPYISGGLGTACLGITSALRKLGHEITFVLPGIGGGKKEPHVKLVSASEISFYETNSRTEQLSKLSKTQNSLNIKVIDSLLISYTDEYQYRKLLAETHSKQPLGVAEKGEVPGNYGPSLLAEVLRYAGAAEIIAYKEKFDIIHGHDWTSVFACLQAKKTRGKPYVYHVHALEFDRSGENINRTIYGIEKYGMETADHIIAVSQYTRESIVSRYGISPEKITVVHNAVSGRKNGTMQRMGENGNRKIVLFLGRITFQKGPNYFVEAARLVLKSLPEVTFVMAGTGDMMSSMMGRIAELRIGENFRFTGFLRGAEVERIYASSDLYVMPSVSEPFGIAPLEAVLHNVPVIISRQSGVSEVLHHVLKVDFWNARELASKIITLLRYPFIGHEMSKHAREELRTIKWEYAAEKILSIYRQVSEVS